MIADVARLSERLDDGVVHLEPLGEEHRDALRAACAADEEIWEIYSASYDADHFDGNFDAILMGPGRCMFAVFAGGVLVGMSGYLNVAPSNRSIEIGNSYLAPETRGTGINRRFKALLIDHAFDCGFNRCEFKVDSRNTRSQAALLKLGAVREGVLRQHVITWTGHVRDSVYFSILRDEWRRG
jgi:RimJ/RimL family protein N-acetyltransferase